MERVIVGELSCPWEAECGEGWTREEDEWAVKAKAAGWSWRNTVEKRRAAKRFKYASGLMSSLPREWKAQLATVEIGARGMVAAETRQDLHNVFRAMGCRKDARQRTELCVAEARRRAMLGSYLVWCFRDRSDWDLTEPIGRWSGKGDGDCLASIDRKRQAEERERECEAGAWTDAAQEDEASGDAGVGEQEWQMKTAARQEVREKAEAAGLQCYYPDGSAKDGLSGWGWVAQRREAEVKREHGPVKLYGEEGWLGAQYHSNNAGELTALIHVLRHIAEHGSRGEEVMIAPDNLWAADVAMGACGGAAHRRLIRTARAAVEEVQERGVTVKWGWAKGHSELEWNEIADKEADRGRKQAAPESAVAEKRARPRHRVLRLEQLVDAAAVREALQDRELAAEAQNWARKMEPRGDGTAAVQSHYVRYTATSRRKPEGLSLQGASQKLRTRIAGRYYVAVEVTDVAATMLQARLARVGKRVRMLDEWCQDRERCAAKVSSEVVAVGGKAVTEEETRELIVNAVHGTGVDRWVRNRWQAQSTPPAIAAFARDMRTVRSEVERWFPEECARGKKTGPDGRRRKEAVKAAITALEIEALDVMREALPKFGLQGDALVDAGLLVRTVQTGATPLEKVVPALEAAVLSTTGAVVKLRARKLDGATAHDWASPQIAQTSPVSGHNTHETSEKKETGVNYL